MTSVTLKQWKGSHWIWKIFLEGKKLIISIVRE